MPQIVLFLLLASLTAIGQTISLKGRVVDAASDEPLPGVSVYFNNTTQGVISDAQGRFELMGEPGRKEIVVSMVSYEPIVFPVDLKASDTLRPYLFKLSEKITELAGVSVEGKRGPEWYDNLEVFKENFLGLTDFAGKCKIRNPEVLTIAFDPKERILKSHSNEALIIENKSLGYVLHYLLVDFTFDMASGYVSYVGYPRFEEMQGGRIKQKKWLKNRLAAFHGSAMELGRALKAKKLEETGFNLRRLYRSPNPERPTEEQLNQARLRLSSEEIGPKRDSLETVVAKGKLPKTIERLDTARVAYEDFISKKDGEVVLGFKDYFNIVYIHEKEEAAFVQSGSPFSSEKRAPTFQTSVISLLSPTVIIEPNGMFVEPLDIVFEGYMAWEKIGNMLPLDYEADTRSSHIP